jgi:hypothetical protein
MMQNITAENIKPYMPLLYLFISCLIVVVCHLVEVPKDIYMLLVGAALTRVKIPSK